MQFTIVELHTIDTPRVKDAPLLSRVVKARTCSTNDAQPQPTVQKLKPRLQLVTDDLKQLRINEKMLEKYPDLSDFIQQLGSDRILVPGNLQT